MLVKAMGVGNGARSMQPLMYDEPQPTCGRIENNSAERDGADHHTPKKDRLSKPPVWIGRKHCPFLLRESYRPNPFKLASRPALGVFDFTRWGDRPEAADAGFTLAPIVMFTASTVT